MMRLIWIRHGETKGNQMKRYIGHLDEPLAETGKEQAFRLAEALSREKIDFVVTSDFFKNIPGFRWPSCRL
jgi:broad specificity phosphatase PhoE